MLKTKIISLNAKRNGGTSPSCGSEEIDSPSSSDSRDSRDDSIHRLKFLFEENKALKLFLKDYGMTWVGDETRTDADGDEKQSSEKKQTRGKKIHSNRLKARADAARAGKASEAETETKEDAEKKSDTSVAAKRATKASKEPGTSKSPNKPFLVDVEKLLASIAELNAVAGDGKSKVVTGANGERKFVSPTPKTITLFSDGFIVDDCKTNFRSFDSETNKAYIKDLLDGFFPYEYKEKFPIGVPFTVIDKSSEIGAPVDKFKAFTGGGKRLDGRKVNQGKKNIVANEKVSDAKPKDTSFLEKLPKVVVRGGVVVDVREDVGAVMHNAQRALQTVLETTVARGCFRRLMAESEQFDGVTDGENTCETFNAPSTTDPSQLSTLRVKGMDGQKMYIVKLSGDDTIGKLRRYLERAVGRERDVSIGKQSDNLFEIRNAYPPKTFTDDTQTLQEAGLVPNATLLLRPIAAD